MDGPGGYRIIKRARVRRPREQTPVKLLRLQVELEHVLRLLADGELDALLVVAIPRGDARPLGGVRCVDDQRGLPRLMAATEDVMDSIGELSGINGLTEFSFAFDTQAHDDKDKP